MPKIHITKTAVDRILLQEKGQVDYFDDSLRGFGVRISTTCKTYFAMRRVNGKLVRTKLDTSDKITAEQARRLAESVLSDMGKGHDPNAEKKRARQQEEKPDLITLEKALQTYVDKRKLKTKTVDLYKQLFKLYLSDWAGLAVTEITAAMVNTRHSEIACGSRSRQKISKSRTKGKGIKAVVDTSKRREAAADGVMRVLRAVLNYTFADDEDAGIVRINPVRTLSRKKAWFKVDRRRTVIKNSQLATWYSSVMSLDNIVMRNYLVLLLFTGLRRQEAATLEWNQIDFKEKTLTIPDTKNKQPHVLPLSDFINNLLTQYESDLNSELLAARSEAKNIGKKLSKEQQIVRNRLAVAESRYVSKYVFSGEGKTGYIVEPKRAIDTVIADTGIVFSCHDLRRTFATIAESLDLSGYAIKALLNHKQQINDVTGGYIVINVDRLRQPMQLISDKIYAYIKGKMAHN